MPILRIQHAVPDYEAWKRAFDSDPMDRKGAGVRHYQVYRALGEPNLIMIDLEFEALEAAERMLEGLHQLWRGPGGAVMRDPRAWLLDRVETRSL